MDCGISLSAHTQEAEEDTERIMKEIVPETEYVYLDRIPSKPTLVFSSAFTASPFRLRLLE